MTILKRALLVFLVLFAAMVCVNKIRFYYNWKSAFLRTLFSPFENTIWAPEFSIENFEKAEIAMNKNEVTKLLGEPLRKDCGSDGECIWIYSWQSSGTDDFDQRWVIFNKDGIVTEMRKNFFID